MNDFATVFRREKILADKVDLSKNEATLTMLWADSADDKLIFFLFFLESKI